MNREEIQKWLDFRIMDDCISVKYNGQPYRYYFFRLHPRNTSILGLEERLGLEAAFRRILDNADTAPQLFILDKAEGLTAQIDCYRELTEKYPAHTRINSEILKILESTENGNISVERAFYFIIKVRNESELNRFTELASDHISMTQAERAELIVIMRNFMLREFGLFDMLEFDKQIELKYQSETGQKQGVLKKKIPDRDEFALRETMKQLLPLRLRFNSRYGEQSGFLRQTITVRNYPTEFNTDCVLRSLALVEGTTVKLSLTPIDISVSNRAMAQQLNQKTSDSKSAKKKSDAVEAEIAVNSLSAAFTKMRENNERFYYLNIFIECYGKDREELKNRTERVKSELRVYGITCDDLIYEQKNAFISVCPIGYDRFPLLSRNMPTATIAALYPLTASRKADPKGLFLGKTGTGSPFLLDPLIHNSEVTNSNLAIIGGSGQGKSYLIKKIIAQLRARNISVYCLDSEIEYADEFNNLEGTNLDCSGGGVFLNPFQIRACRQISDSDLANDDPDCFKQSTAFKQHLSWLRSFFHTLWPDMSEQQLNILMILTQDMYNRQGINDGIETQDIKNEDYPTFDTLYGFCENVYRDFDGKRYFMFNAEELQPILLYLHEAVYGAAGAVFCGTTNIKDDTAINFLIAGLMEGDINLRNAAMLNIVSYIWNTVVTKREPLVFVVDELYLTLIPEIAGLLRNFAKRARKYNAMLITATQDLADYDNPQIIHLAKPLLTLPSHRFYFNLGEIEKSVVKRVLNLSEPELEVIAESRRGHCLVKTGNQKYELMIGTLSYEAELFGSGGGN